MNKFVIMDFFYFKVSFKGLIHYNWCYKNFNKMRCLHYQEMSQTISN